MTENRSQGTALDVLQARYAFSKEGWVPEWHQEEGIFLPKVKRIILDTPLRGLVMRGQMKKTPGLLEYLIAREKIFEEAVGDFIEDKKDVQVVNIGAGYDLQPLAMPKYARHESVVTFQIDGKATLDNKRRILGERELLAEFEGKVRTIAYDDEQGRRPIERIISEMKSSEYQEDKPTLWIAKGLAPYVTSEEIKGYLREGVKSGNQLVMDCTVPEMSRDHPNHDTYLKETPGAREADRHIVDKKGEEIRWDLEAGKFLDLLTKYGARSCNLQEEAQIAEIIPAGMNSRRMVAFNYIVHATGK